MISTNYLLVVDFITVMRILFGIQGTGNGHVSRCRTLARALQQTGVEVDYLLSGRDADGYFDIDVFGDYQLYQGISFATKNGKINLLKTAQAFSLRQLRKDIRNLDLSSYDFVISDFEPITAWAARQQQKDCIGISNQVCAQYLNPQQYGLVARAIMKYYAPVTQAVGLHWFHFGHPILPPIIDPLQSAGENGKIVVYLPFESLEAIDKLLSHFPQQQFICFHPQTKQPQSIGHIDYFPLARQHFTDELTACSGIITNTGFALISEALILGKKILTKPLHGQFEQIYNADCLAKLQLATIMPQLDPAMVSVWLEQASPQAIHYPDVATPLAEWLASNRRESLAELSQRLWQQVIFPEVVQQRIKALGFA